MARNIEIKARIKKIESITAMIAAIAEEGPIDIVQDDTFFNCPNGRLKLRAFSPSAGELIFYQRADNAEPKTSFYVITTTSDPDRLREVLSTAYGTAGHVYKRRILYLVGRTRIHLDRVEGLGDFLELEVVLDEHEATETGMTIAHELLQKFRITPEQLVEGAYVDLLAKIPLTKGT